jgi:hypothetical protein
MAFRYVIQDNWDRANNSWGDVSYGEYRTAKAALSAAKDEADGEGGQEITIYEVNEVSRYRSETNTAWVEVK